jgi:hypothetical protein
MPTSLVMIQCNSFGLLKTATPDFVAVVLFGAIEGGTFK